MRENDYSSVGPNETELDAEAAWPPPDPTTLFEVDDEPTGRKTKRKERSTKKVRGKKKRKR